MSGETARSESAWTLDTLHEHMKALRDADRELRIERDRRYSEVALEREKAIKIKEQADRDALDLARQIQLYKDEKANDLREQINRERGFYASKSDVVAAVEKIDATMAPILVYVASQQGRSGGLSSGWGYLLAAVGALGTLLAIGVALLSLFRR